MNVVEQASQFATQSLAMCRAHPTKTSDSHGVLASVASDMSAALGDTEKGARGYDANRGWVYSAVRPIAQRLAGQPVHVARLTQGGSGSRGINRPTKGILTPALKNFHGELELLVDHPILQKFNTPNPIMTSWELKYAMVASYVLTGVGYLWMPEEKDGINIWPMPSTWVKPSHKKGMFAEFEITPHGGLTGSSTKTRPAEEFARFVNPDPADPFGFKSTIDAQSPSISADQAMQVAQAALFGNGIWPRYAIQIGDIHDVEGKGRATLLDAEDREEITQAILDIYGDVYEYGKPLILDALIKDIKRISNSPEEMDFLQSGQITKARILQGVGTPSAIIGDLENVNRAGSAVAKSHFCQFTLNPLVEYMSQALTRFVVPRFAEPEENLVMWIEPCVPDDPESDRLDMALLAKHAAISRNEMRSKFGLPPMDNGETIVVPQNWIEIPVEPKVQRAKKSKSRKITFRKDVRKLTLEEKRQRWLKSHGSLESDWVGDVAPILDKLGRTTAREIRELDVGKRFDASSESIAIAQLALAASDYEKRLFDENRRNVLVSLSTGALEETRDSPKAIDPESILIQLPPEVQSAIRAELQIIMAEPYWGELSLTIMQDLATHIDAGINSGLSMREIAKGIEGPDGVLGANANRKRALRIARTEVTGALNAGHTSARQELVDAGIVQEIEWITIMDQTTRGSHIALNQTMVPAKDGFQVGSAATRVPHPAHHSLPVKERVNCRCSVVSVFK